LAFYQFVELTIGVLEVLKMLKNLETPLGGSMSKSARTCKEIMLLNSTLPDGKKQSHSSAYTSVLLLDKGTSDGPSFRGGDLKCGSPESSISTLKRRKLFFSV